MNEDPERVENERVVLVLEKVHYPFTPINILVGDILLTPDHLHYLPYSEFQSAGRAGAGLAGLLGGLQGGIAASLDEKNKRDNALEVYEKRRRIHWGMNLSERLTGDPNVITVERQRVLDLSMTDILTFTDGAKSFEFAVPDLAEQKEAISMWLDGSLAESQQDCVVSGKHTAPQLVLEGLVAGQVAGPVSDELEAIAADEDYMGRFWGLFLYLSGKDRRAVRATVDRIGGPFREKFVSLRQAAVRSGKRSLPIGIAALLVGAAMLLPMMLPVLEGRGDEPGTLLGSLSAFGGVMVIILGTWQIWEWARSLRF